MISLEGRRILILGGGSGIGWAGAEIATAMGAKVAVADIDPDAQTLVEGLGANAHFLGCDATKPDQVHAMVAAADEALGGIDGLFTTVGGAHLAPLDDISAEDWDKEIAFNLSSIFHVCQTALPRMAGKPGAAMVLTSSGYAIMAGPDRVGYTAAKAGVIAMNRSLAAIAAKDGVRVNCIAPGPTDTPRFRAMSGGDEGVERVRRMMPLGTIPKPEECAQVALFLLSNAASQVTGQTIHVNGGLLMP